MSAVTGHGEPEYVSARLILRRFLEEDARFVWELHANPDLARFIPSAILSDIEAAAGWIQRITSTCTPGRGWWCVTLHDGTPVGAVLLKGIRYSVGHAGDDVEIGWRWHPEHTGRGYATEAAELLLAMGLAGGLERIVAVVDEANTASQEVCRRIGMQPRGATDVYYDEHLQLFEARRGTATTRQVDWVGEDDPTRTDTAHVILDDGLRAFGRQTTPDYSAAWAVDARQGWVTRSVAVAVTGPRWRRTLYLVRDPETRRWSAQTHTEGVQPAHLPEPGIADPAALTDALDCDLGLCPLTNTMPIRRLRLQSERVPARPMTMAWIHMPALHVTASPQEYAGDGTDRVTYTSGTRNTTYTLSLDPDGLVMRYPGLADRK